MFDSKCTAPVSYRTPPPFLTTQEIIAELTHFIANAEGWPGPVGDYARGRAADLRAELRRREVPS